MTVGLEQNKFGDILGGNYAQFDPDTGGTAPIADPFISMIGVYVELEKFGSRNEASN